MKMDEKTEKRIDTINKKRQEQEMLDVKLQDINDDISKYERDYKVIGQILAKLYKERDILNKERKNIMFLEIDSSKFRVLGK